MRPDVIFILVLASIFSLTKFAGVKVYSEMKVQMSLDTVQMRVMLSTIKANMSRFLRFPDVSHQEASASFFTVGWGSDTCKVHFHCKRLLSSMSPDVNIKLIFAMKLLLTKLAGVKVYSEIKAPMSLERWYS